MDAIQLAQALTSPQPSAFSLQPSIRGWVRLRGIDLGKATETRESLLKLRAAGIKTCVFLRRSVGNWKVSYLPDDLREAYEHGRKLGANYGDLVDAWEVDNEPDLGFVPESAERYTAFLKATYLGLKAGAAEAKEQSGKSKVQNALPLAPRPSPYATNGPLVLMGSLGLPPGPWLERFVANNGFSYTDGFNYHYYGYAEDFTGVYRQFEEAVTELSAKRKEQSENSSPLALGPLQRKALPIFLTEVGYGMLGKSARDTKEGRLRQWRWFKSVGEQLGTLRPEAPMAFYLPPYLEYDISEYGLTVPARPAAGSKEHGARSSDTGQISYLAGGIEYSPADFDADMSEPWMSRIGSDIGGNQVTPALAQWLDSRKSSGLLASISRSENRGQAPGGQQATTASSQPSERSRSWSVTTAPPSLIVIDFLPGEGLSHVKRYNGLFVTGRESPVHAKAEGGRRPGPDGEAKLKAEDSKPKPLPPSPSPSAPARSEEFILQIRTQNGNLYEVYPTRQATPDWQRFLEPGDNFTMAFYGRAALPWRFKDNKPASLLVVMYPKSLPATYEFRRPQLIKLGAGSREPGASAQAQVSGFRSQVSPSVRYGSGTIVLYNFSDKPVTGRLELPSALCPLPDSSEYSAKSAASVLKLLPNERREVQVTVKVPWNRYTRIEAPITFVPEDSSIPPARFLTSLIPDVAGLPATLIANLLPQEVERVAVSAVASREGRAPNALSNRSLIPTRPRASEEAPMVEQRAESKGPSEKTNMSDSPAPSPHALTAFVQPGAQVAFTADGFSLTISSLPPGKHQRIEVEIPWPDGLAFGEDEFLSIEFRLRP